MRSRRSCFSAFEPALALQGTEPVAEALLEMSSRVAGDGFAGAFAELILEVFASVEGGVGEADLAGKDEGIGSEPVGHGVVAGQLFSGAQQEQEIELVDVQAIFVAEADTGCCCILRDVPAFQTKRRIGFGGEQRGQCEWERASFDAPLQ